MAVASRFKICISIFQISFSGRTGGRGCVRRDPCCEGGALGVAAGGWGGGGGAV
jgi:hypothetical protein